MGPLAATGPIFFYAGNEGPVETYIANTGLMWESAPRFAALVVFAEHRYYGASQVCGPNRPTAPPSPRRS